MCHTVKFIDISNIPANAVLVGTVATGLPISEPTHLQVYHGKKRTYFVTIGEFNNNLPFSCAGLLTLPQALAAFLEDYNNVTG